MTNPSKAKGTRFETDVLRYLQESEITARRNAPSGAKDVGDIRVGDTFTLEAKACARIELAAFVDEANVEAHHAGTPYGAAVVKRRRKGVGDAFVVMDLTTFSNLVSNHSLDGAWEH